MMLDKHTALVLRQFSYLASAALLFIFLVGFGRMLDGDECQRHLECQFPAHELTFTFCGLAVVGLLYCIAAAEREGPV